MKKKGHGKREESSRLSKFILLLRWIKKKFDLKKLIKRTAQRQRSLSFYTGQGSCEESRLSYSFGIAKIISAILLGILLILTVIFGVDVISYDKAYYMFKDISYIKSFGEGVPSELSYSKPVQNQIFDDFKNGLMVASDSELKFFTSTGRVTMTSGSEFANPKVSASDGYVLIYDQGRNLFSVYNSFVKLYSENTDHQISLADMSDNGRFLIVTSSKEYDSVIKVYDESYKLTSQFNMNSHVISASLSSNGRYAAILSLTALDGTAISEVKIIDCKKDKVIASSSYKGSMPYKCDYLTDDRIAVFLDDKALVLNGKGSELYQYAYPSGAERIEIGDEKYAMIFSSGGNNANKTLAVFDKDGKRVFLKQFSGIVNDVKLYDSFVYILKNSELIRYNISLGTESTYTSAKDSSRIVVLSDGKLVLCSQSSASYISFD